MATRSSWVAAQWNVPQERIFSYFNIFAHALRLPYTNNHITPGGEEISSPACGILWKTLTKVFSSSSSVDESVVYRRVCVFVSCARICDKLTHRRVFKNVLVLKRRPRWNEVASALGAFAEACNGSRRHYRVTRSWTICWASRAVLQSYNLFL